jgi:arylsulfatase A-like enzyme
MPTAGKPNIIMIMADDVGIWHVSAYHRGMMGGRTPNIDRLAREGALFTDYYGQQSCTAGRAAFITGQTPFRTGLLKVGLAAAEQGLQDSDDFIDRSVKAKQPFLLWHNSTRCHSFTHLSKKWDGKTGFGLFADAMAELDWIVGE